MQNIKIRQSAQLQLSTTISSQEQSLVKDRFANIQQKLERLTIMKAEHKEISNQERIASKLQEIQLKFKEQGYAIEQKVQLFREMLIEMRIWQQQREKQSIHLIKQRRNRIRQVRRQIQQALQEQSKARQNSEKRNIQKFCREASSIEQLFISQSECLSQKIELMQSKFQNSLPRLHQCISTSNNYLSCHIEQKGKTLLEQSEDYKKSIRIEQAHQEKSNRQVKEFLSYTIGQIMEEMDHQRRERRSMQQKLQYIIKAASKQLHHQ